MMRADYLFLLTDVDCLFTANPRSDPSAQPIEVVSSVSAIRTQGAQIHQSLSGNTILIISPRFSEHIICRVQYGHWRYGHQAHRR